MSNEAQELSAVGELWAVIVGLFWEEEGALDNKIGRRSLEIGGCRYEAIVNGVRGGNSTVEVMGSGMELAPFEAVVLKDGLLVAHCGPASGAVIGLEELELIELLQPYSRIDDGEGGAE